MLTGYPLSCTLGRSVGLLGIGSGVARFLMTAEYATYRYLRCVVNVAQSTVLFPLNFHLCDPIGIKSYSVWGNKILNVFTLFL